MHGFCTGSQNTTEHISILCTSEFSLATGTSELGSYYHPHFTDSETESLSSFPTMTPFSICSETGLETFHTLCSVSAYSYLFQAPVLTSAFTIFTSTQSGSCPACLLILFLVAVLCQMSLSFHCLCQILGEDHSPSVTHHLSVGSFF